MLGALCDDPENGCSPVLLLFSIFPFAEHFLGFILVGKVFEKAFRILE